MIAIALSDEIPGFLADGYRYGGRYSERYHIMHRLPFDSAPIVDEETAHIAGAIADLGAEQ
ncbi:hypothetical protein I6F35_33510 [Bradyrhizobium sp. BRP22]|uniref:hypothetical protein n=1 Tax=Bradyrhizobium sp. BRP22 TaxID=2793821 RepID=UPI001CD72608|nr:hypothetical protein [Bradyrhizobium sp. BRP22]MCA1458053.1 hypothetical protein [Bradyrhizobium sp. BRP22]